MKYIKTYEQSKKFNFPIIRLTDKDAMPDYVIDTFCKRIRNKLEKGYTKDDDVIKRELDWIRQVNNGLIPKKIQELLDSYKSDIMFEKHKSRNVELIGYPEGNIIHVTEDERRKLKEDDFNIVWDDEIDYEEGVFGQWSFDNNQEDEIREWLKNYRKIYKKMGSVRGVEDVKKYNL